MHFLFLTIIFSFISCELAIYTWSTDGNCSLETAETIFDWTQRIDECQHTSSGIINSMKINCDGNGNKPQVLTYATNDCSGSPALTLDISFCQEDTYNILGGGFGFAECAELKDLSVDLSSSKSEYYYGLLYSNTNCNATDSLGYVWKKMKTCEQGSQGRYISEDCVEENNSTFTTTMYSSGDCSVQGVTTESYEIMECFERDLDMSTQVIKCPPTVHPTDPSSPGSRIFASLSILFILISLIL